MKKIYVIFIELCAKRDSLTALKGINYHKNVHKSIILKSLEMCKWSK